jgi:hypothetical protein
MRTPPIGPSKGIGLTVSAADAALRAITSNGFWLVDRQP